MRQILTVTTAATVTKLATRERVKQELDITNSASDALLDAKLDEASSDIEAALGFTVARESVSETFWHEGFADSPEYITLNRTPVVSIDSVTLDDQVIDASLYRLDAATGQLFALNSSGYPFPWLFSKSLIVAYSGGYLLPGQSGRNLPPGIEGAAVELLSDFWLAKGRDPSVRSEEIPGVMRTDYWVGAVGEEGQLPPRVLMKLAPFRRAQV